jgi:anti-anti-sigma factor
MERFRITADTGEATCVLTLGGEADLAVAADIVKLGTAALQQQRTNAVVVDLSGVTFMDATSLGALIELRNAADKLGKPLRLHGIPPRVQRLLDLTGLSDHFASSGQADSPIQTHAKAM